jgi:hypothetical protein
VPASKAVGRWPKAPQVFSGYLQGNNEIELTVCIQAIGLCSFGYLPRRRSSKQLNNLPITPKISILVAVSMLGLFSAGLLAGYLMQKEMINSRVEQTCAITDIAKNLAIGLQKQVDAGQTCYIWDANMAPASTKALGRKPRADY